MHEFALALQSMTEAHYQWPMPVPVAVVQPVRPASPSPCRTLSPEEEKALSKAVKFIASHATGRLVFDPVSGFYVAEVSRKRTK